MQTTPSDDTRPGGCDFDFSTPEAQAALAYAQGLVLEIRDGLRDRPLERKVALYERSLGLAVVPVLLRRAFYALWWRLRPNRSEGR